MAQVVKYRVTGLRELLRVTDQLPRDVKKGVRDELRNVAEPVRADAQELFLARISNSTKKSRYGISVRKAGTITVEQRVKSKLSRSNRKLKRPRFADLQMQEALEPALFKNEDQIVDRFEHAIDSATRRWAVL
jgi:hypothetical protein